jgi:peptidoglycan/LPS O-acetylase OafA/YrhL
VAHVATTVDRAPVPPDPPDRPRPAGFRPDVEGLRAVAVGLVLLYHAGLPIMSGGFVGVDVFFVISGFLITGLLVRELERGGTISLARFYARRAKRLLPATAVVLLSTAGLVLAVVPRIRWSDIGADIVASALYVVNWRLADQSVDYLAEDVEPSPVQHFWSLAVEEQYYLVWPVLLLAVTWLARRRGRRLGRSLWLGLAIVAVPSFAWSIHQTAYEPASAFFVTTTRMWELALGAALAIGAAKFARMPRPVAVLLGWAGLGAIVVAGLVVTVTSAWPGYAALLPTLGAAAVIAAGTAAGRRGPTFLLGTTPFLWVGALSYSLYLWHWPLLIVATAHWDGLSVGRGLLVAAFSFLPAWLTYRLVENPLRFSASLARLPRLALSLGANCTLAGVVAGLVILLAVPTPTSTPDIESAAQSRLGAAVLAESPRDDPAGAPVDRVEWITPDPVEATEDVPDLYADGCQQDGASAEPVSCSYGSDDAGTTIALVGDSKAAQWAPALQILAQQNDWRLVTYTKSRCSFTTAEITIDGEIYESCSDWNDNVLAELTGANRPDYVVTSGGRSAAVVGGGSSAQDAVGAMVAGLQESWDVLISSGVNVIVIADTPDTGFNVYECVSENPDRLTECTYDRQESQGAGVLAQLQATDSLSDVTYVDLSDAICPTARCAPVIGNVLVYRQGSHLTATYVETLAPRVGVALERAMGGD